MDKNDFKNGKILTYLLPSPRNPVEAVSSFLTLFLCGLVKQTTLRVAKNLPSHPSVSPASKKGKAWIGGRPEDLAGSCRISHVERNL